MNSASLATLKMDNLGLNFKKLLKICVLISHLICMVLVYIEVKFYCDVHVGVGYRSGISLPPALTPKKLQARGTRLGIEADQQSSNPVFTAT